MVAKEEKRKQAQLQRKYFLETIHQSDNAIMLRDFPKPKLAGDESDIELLLLFNIPLAITMHSLKSLASKGNMVAFDIYSGNNQTISKEDLIQEVALWFIDHAGKWRVYFDGKVEFYDNDLCKQAFGIVSHYLYQFATKHYRKAYISLDGEEVAIDNVVSLSAHSDLNSAYIKEFIEEFSAFLTDSNITKYRKNSNDMLTFLHYRMNGYTIANTAIAMNVSRDRVKYLNNLIREAYESFTE